MIIKILSAQIPVFWETIKFCTVQANAISEDNRQEYLNGLLHSLLNDKSQCFVRLDDRRRLIAMMVTKIDFNKLTMDRSLYIQSFYSFQGVPDDQWIDEYKLLIKFAKKVKCSIIVFETPNENAMRIGQMGGFQEVSRRFELKVG